MDLPATNPRVWVGDLVNLRQKLGLCSRCPEFPTAYFRRFSRASSYVLHTATAPLTSCLTPGVQFNRRSGIGVRSGSVESKAAILNTEQIARELGAEGMGRGWLLPISADNAKFPRSPFHGTC